MIRRLSHAALALAALLCVPGSSTAETGFLNRTINFNGGTYRYQVYVPADFDSSKPWPVVLFLHGNTRQGTDGLRQTNGGFPNDIRQNPSFFPALIVLAQAQPNTRWLHPEMEELAMAELEATLKEFGGDPSRTYLVGYSMGATGVYRILYKWPQRFTAAIAVAGRVEPPPAAAGYPAEDLGIDKKQHDFVNSRDPFSAVAAVIKHIPLRIFHGDMDQTVPVEQSRRLAPALKALGADVDYVELPGVGHNEVAERVFLDQAPMAWLLSQRRKSN